MIKNIITVILLIFAISIMLKLGFWQLDRLEWKEEILSKIEQYESVDASKTPLDLNNPDDFQRGFIEGQFFTQKPILIRHRTNDKGEVGHHLLYPFKSQKQNIIINMGWHNGQTHPVPSQYKQKLTGYLRSPDKKSSFTPANAIDAERFYAVNIDDFEKFYGVELFDKVLYLDDAFPNMQKPRNKHAQYATFWFGMSGLLLFLTGFFIWRQKFKS